MSYFKAARELTWTGMSLTHALAVLVARNHDADDRDEAIHFLRGTEFEVTP